jgi:hypothetical protein
MIGIVILAVLIFISLVAAVYDLVHDGYGRVRTDWARAAACDEPRTRARFLHVAH